MREVSAYIAGALKKPLPKAVAEKTKITCSTRSRRWCRFAAPAGRRPSLTEEARGRPEAGASGPTPATAEHAALANGMLGMPTDDDSRAVPLPSRLRHRARRAGDGGARAPRRHGPPAGRSAGRPTSAPGSTWLHGYEVATPGIRLTASTDSACRSRRPLAGVNATGRAGAVVPRSSVPASRADARRGHIEKSFDPGGSPRERRRRRRDDPGMHRRGGRFLGNATSSWPTTKRIASASHPSHATAGSDRPRVMNTSIKRWSVGSPIQAPLLCST
jgi:hypothetical protein